MTYVHVVGVGAGATDPVACAVRELGADEVVVIGTPADHRLVADLLDPLGLASRRVPEKPGGIRGILEAVVEVVESEPADPEDVVVNLTPASRTQAYGLRLGSLATGAQAIRVGSQGVERLPRLWLDLDVVVGKPEREILQALAASGGDSVSLSELSREAGLPREEVAYRIRGGEEAPGLEVEGLVDIDCPKGRPRLTLTETGALLGGRLGGSHEREARPVTVGSPID